MKLAKDKKLHMLGGAGISLVAGGWLANPLFGLAVAVLIGILKEAYDSTGRGDTDVMDFGATAFGGVIGACILIALL